MPKTNKRLKNKKNKTKIFWIVFISAGILAVLGALWYEYIYNPVLYKLNTQNHDELHETMSDLCSIRVATTSGYSTRKKYLCRCYADNLTDKVYNKLIRKRAFHRTEEFVWNECKEAVRYSNMSAIDLKDMFEKQCLQSLATNSKFCECYGNNMAYIMKKRYVYESDIVSDLQPISREAFEMCNGTRKK